MLNFLKNTLIILLITVGLLLLLEGITRVCWNQVSYIQTLSEGDHAIELDSNSYTFRYVPGTKYNRICPEFSAYYEINSEGMRDPNTYLDKPRDSSKIRILALGDSFTYGEGSDQEDTWLTRLENDLKLKGKAVEIVKAGVGAFDQYQEYYYLKELIDSYHPDYVMIGFLANDIIGNKPLEHKGMPANLQTAESNDNAGGGLSLRKLLKKYRTLNFAKQFVLSNDAIYQQMYEKTSRGDYFRTVANMSDEVAAQYEITSKLFDQIDSLGKSRGAPLIVVSIPQFYEVIAQNHDDVIDSAVDDYFLPVASEKAYTWVSTLEQFKEGYKNGIKTHYRVDGHLTPEGNRILANTVKENLEKTLR